VAGDVLVALGAANALQALAGRRDVSARPWVMSGQLLKSLYMFFYQLPLIPDLSAVALPGHCSGGRSSGRACQPIARMRTSTT
jgi:hypothetical protein